jgi:hypothetical protein
MHLAYLTVLACVARADGVITPEEREVLRRALATVDDAGVRARVDALLDLAQDHDVKQLLTDALGEINAPHRDAETRAGSLAELLRDCYIMASVDGNISLPEVALIDRVLAIAQVPEQRRPTLHQWGEAAARQMLDGTALALETIMA